MTPQRPQPPPETVLPPPDTERWSPSRKAAVVAAVRAGLISAEEACRRYMLSVEELAAWEKAFDQNGVPGLRATRQQNYRNALLERGREPVRHPDMPRAAAAPTLPESR